MSFAPCNCKTICQACKKHGERALMPSCERTKAAPCGFTAAQRRNRIYVAGPMTGLPDFNYPAFNAAALELRTQGWHVENPADHGVIEGAEWADYLAYDLTRLGTCGAIYLLPDWEKSKGARLEVHIAKTMGLEIVLHPHAISPAPFTDTELLDFVEAHTVNVENEWEGPWSALVYEDTSSPITMEDGKTARTAIALAKQKHEQLTGAEA